MLKYASLLILVLLIGCGQEIVCTGMCAGDELVCSALEKAGNNRGELEKVLRHCKTNSMKHKAAKFLIANMEGHSFYRFALLDSLDNELEIDVLAYPNYEMLCAAFDSVEVEVGELHWDTTDHQPDLEFITADYLIENIDLAFEAWQNRPWAKKMNFDDFCNFVLPYRGSSEPLEQWRQYFLDRYKDLPSQMTDPTNPVEAVSLINKDIKSWFTFDPRFYSHPTDQGLSEMLACGLGRCEDMTNLAIYAMRANGLGVTSDYTPAWADTGNNHAWNAILIPGGGVVPFMGCESEPGDYNLRRRMAKAYRKSYAKNYDNPIYLRTNDDEKIPGWLRGRSYKDVTTNYTPVADASMSLTDYTDVQFAYLCVFNSGEWTAIHWSEIDNGNVNFVDMGTDICYLPMYLEDDDLVAAYSSIILQNDGSIRTLTLGDKTETVIVSSTTRRKLDASTDNIEQTFLNQGATYELFYWDKEWVSLGEQTAGDKALKFENAPQGALFWMVEEGSRKEERIFTWDGDRQVWW